MEKKNNQNSRQTNKPKEIEKPQKMGTDFDFKTNVE